MRDTHALRRSVEYVLKADKDVIDTAAYRAPELKLLFDEIDTQREEFKQFLRIIDERYRMALQSSQHYPDHKDEVLLDRIQEFLR